MLLGGVGMALVMTPSAAAAVRSVPVDQAGVGSAVLNAFRQVGGSMGIAVMGAIVAAQVGGRRVARDLRRRLLDGARRRCGDRVRGRGGRLRHRPHAPDRRRAGAGGGGRVTEVARVRMRAEERRAAVLETACRTFSRGTYHGTTTAEIARAAGVSEPILYRHFPSKRDLYLACIEETWRRTRARWDKAVESESDPAEWVAALGRAFHEWGEQRALISNLWLQSLSEASEDPKIRAFVAAHIRKVHAYVAGVVTRSQAEGGIERERIRAPRRGSSSGSE